MYETGGPGSLQWLLEELLAELGLRATSFHDLAPVLGAGRERGHIGQALARQRGFPDWVIVGPRGVLWRELKSEFGTLRPEQRLWGRVLRAAGADWAIWRPSDWLDGTVERELRGIM
jgi:hypothetical protein